MSITEASLFESSSEEPYPMREPCKSCGGGTGRIETRNGQDCVYCLDCGRHCYNAPRTETGREIRTLRTRPDIKVSQRARILDRDGARCVICHRADRDLDIGHLVSDKDGRALGMTDAELYDDNNLAAMCSTCNSGYGEMSISPRVMLTLIRARQARQQRNLGGAA